jgi:hypothetical protein
VRTSDTTRIDELSAALKAIQNSDRLTKIGERYFNTPL